ncbi:hypothetical protein Nmel_013726, partial [Mimus melanotis]
PDPPAAGSGGPALPCPALLCSALLCWRATGAAAMSGAERPEGNEAAAAGDPGRSLGRSDASPDEGVVEDLPLIDEKAVEQLTEGLISHYLPDLQRSKSALQELT